MISASALAASPVTAMAFSRDGSLLLTGAYKKVVIRSVKDSARQAELECDLPKLNALAFSPDGRWLAVGGGTPGEQGKALLFSWNANASRNQDVPDVSAITPAGELAAFDDLVTSVAFNADGTRLALASADHSVDVVRLGSEGLGAKPVFSLTGHSGPVLGVAFSPNGKVLVTASADRSLRVWESENGNPLRTFSHHTAIIHCVVFKPPVDGTAAATLATCATGSDDKTVRVWQPEIGRMVRIVRSHDGAILALAYSRDGSKLFSAGSEGIVRIIDAASDAVLHQWKAHEDWIYALALSPDGRTLATGDWSGTVKFWDLDEKGPAVRNPSGIP